MHQTAFIITDVKLPTSRHKPSESQLRKAAGHAILAAWKAQQDPEGTDFESFSLGSRQYHFIQGQFRANSDQFGTLPHHRWPQMSHHVMSGGREPDLSDEAIEAIPLFVLRNIWNTGKNLIELGLENEAARGTGRPDRGLIYPDLLLNSNGILAHCVGVPDQDVFGNTPRREGNIAEKYVAPESRDMAFQLACEPIRRLERAQFQADYLRHLVRYEKHVVLEADWDM